MVHILGRCLYLVWVSILLSGCLGGLSSARKQADQYQFRSEKIQTDMFDLQAFLSPESTAQTLRIVFEGDGLAYRFGKVSADPTPRQSTGLQIALASYDPSSHSEAVAYLARPCQFVTSRQSGRPHLCDNPIYWTHHRYAPYVIAQMVQAVTQLQRRYQADQLEFVGYSGGGVMALLLAAQMPDKVSHVTTIASPIDLGAWVRHHDLTPLIGSLDPMDYLSVLRKIPQLHVVGAEDDNIPASLMSGYRHKIKTEWAAFLTAAGRDHQGDWPSFWPQIISAVQ